MKLRTDRPGIALLVVMLLTMVVAAIAAGAALIGANSFLINEYDSQSSLLQTVADAGLELGRARLNANPTLFNDTAPSPLEYEAAVYDATGAVIPGVVRTVYAMPLGGGLGEYGNFAALVAIARMADGAKVVRRLDMTQQSFAVYAYFTNFEPEDITFGNNDQFFGPVHSNSDIKISSTGATFNGPTTTAGSFVGASYATFGDDTASNVTPIAMPTTGQLTALRDRAAPANLAFTAAAGGNEGQSTLRLHFIARDVNDDGVNEGFVRVYRSGDPDWVTANIPVGDSLGNTRNCGHFEGDGGRFSPVTNDVNGHAPSTVLNDGTRSRCFLGGSDEWNATSSKPTGVFAPVDDWGAWDVYPGTPDPPITGTVGDEGNLFPIDRRLNPGFRGVIFVDGKVVVSGTVRGRVTVAATGNIIIGDDLVYDTNPGSATCVDMLGLFSGNNVIVADNTINAPRRIPNTTTHRTYDDTPAENIDATILALNQFTVQNPGSGSTSAESCNGTPWGRGCLNLTGGLIQGTRGIVSFGSGTGNMKRYTHDTCAFTAPPPYIPSTGHFWRGRYHEVDPVGFDINAYFEALN